MCDATASPSSRRRGASATAENVPIARSPGEVRFVRGDRLDRIDVPEVGTGEAPAGALLPAVESQCFEPSKLGFQASPPGRGEPTFLPPNLTLRETPRLKRYPGAYREAGRGRGPGRSSVVCDKECTLPSQRG